VFEAQIPLSMREKLDSNLEKFVEKRREKMHTNSHFIEKVALKSRERSFLWLI
jgi:hypothetical protein